MPGIHLPAAIPAGHGTEAGGEGGKDNPAWAVHRPAATFSHQPLPPLSSPRPVETWTRSKTFQHKKGDYRKVGETLFTGACQDRTRGNGCQLMEGRDRVDIGKK